MERQSHIIYLALEVLTMLMGWLEYNKESRIVEIYQITTA